MVKMDESRATPENRPGRGHRARIARIPFLIALFGILAATLVWSWRPVRLEYNAIAIGICGVILIFDLPVCVLVVYEWLRTGEPPELSLSPLFPCREQREFRRNLRERTKLSDDDFFAVFYSHSQIPKELVVQLRKSLEGAFGLDFAALHPTDNLIFADAELDWADVMFRLNRNFDIVLTKEMFRGFDGTFDALLRLVHSRVGEARPVSMP